jgi:hypothetical protein
MPIWLYDWNAADSFSEEAHGPLRRRLTEVLSQLVLE